MRFMLSLVLLTALAVVGQACPAKPQPANPAIPVVKDANVLFHVYRLASGAPKVVNEAPAPVSSLEKGLPYVQGVSKLPIIAMSESEDWFFYATSVGQDGTGRPGGVFISGYAIKRDGRQVIPWSGW